MALACSLASWTVEDATGSGRANRRLTSPSWQVALCGSHNIGDSIVGAKLNGKGMVLQAEAAKVAKVREAAIAKLKSLEKQKAEVEKTRDDIKCVPIQCCCG